MFSLVSESRLCFQTGVKREKNGGKRDVKGCWEIAEGEYARIERGKKWTWRRMARDSCKDEGGWVKKQKRREKERREICSFLYLLCPGCTLPDVFSYSSDTKHDFATKPLIAITSSRDNSTVPSPPSSSSHPQPPYYSSQWECRPSALSLDLQPPPPGDIHPPIFHSSPSYKVDSPWPLWTDTHVFTSVCLRK